MAICSGFAASGRNPRVLWPYYLGLLASLALNAVVPLDYFLGLGVWGKADFRPYFRLMAEKLDATVVGPPRRPGTQGCARGQ